MQFESTRMYRVKAVADALDVSVATIYRAVESGKLDAFKIGTGKGAIRIPGYAIPAYLEDCARAAAVPGERVGLTDALAHGRACVVCGSLFVLTGVSHVPVGHSGTGSQTFACVGRCEQRAATAVAGEVA